MPPTLARPAPAVTTNRVTARLHRWRKAKSALASGFSFACALIVVAPLALVLGYLFIKGASSLNLAFFFNLPSSPGETGGGVANAIVGTFVLIGIASAIGVPVGVFGAMYLTEYGGPKFNAVIRTSADILNGVPSIVWGIVAYAILVDHNVIIFGHTFWKKGILRDRRGHRAGLHHDPDGPAHDGGSAPARAQQLPRGRRRAGHQPLAHLRPYRRQDGAQGHRHRRRAGHRARGG